MAAPLVIDSAAFTPLAAPSQSVRPEVLDATVETPARLAGLRQGLILALRFVQARFLSVWGLIVAASLCPASVFTDLAIFSALASFMAIAALLRFDAVFFQSNDSARLLRAFRLALAVCALMVAVLAVGLFIAGQVGWVVRAFGALFVISVASRALIRLILAEAAAEGDFATIGNSNIVQALVQPGMMILLIWPLGATTLALLAADAFGHLVALGYMIWRRRAMLVRAITPAWSWRELRESGQRWSAAPRFLLPSTLLSFGFMVAPLLALPLSASPLMAAHVALGMRLLEMPTQMFSAVSVPLVMNNLRLREGLKRQQWARFITLCLVVVAAVMFAGIAAASLVADAWLEGTQWDGVGLVIGVLALFYGGSALVAPLHEIGSLSQHPRRQMAMNAVALAAAGLAITWFGTLSMALLGSIGVISLLRMVAHAQFAWSHVGTETTASPAKA